jgi:hypothetical protein
MKNKSVLFRQMKYLLIQQLKKNDHFYEDVKVLLIIKHHQNVDKHVQKQMKIIIIQKMK